MYSNFLVLFAFNTSICSSLLSDMIKKCRHDKRTCGLYFADMNLFMANAIVLSLVEFFFIVGEIFYETFASSQIAIPRG